MAFAALAAGATTAQAGEFTLPEPYTAVTVGEHGHPHYGENPRVWKFWVPPDNRHYIRPPVYEGAVVFESSSSTGSYNEVYLNPLTTSSCFDHGHGDYNKDYSIGYVQKHDGDWDKYYTNHMTFWNKYLSAGQWNYVVICSRGKHDGRAYHDLDSFKVRNMAIHYRMK